MSTMRDEEIALPKVATTTVDDATVSSEDKDVVVTPTKVTAVTESSSNKRLVRMLLVALAALAIVVGVVISSGCLSKEKSEVSAVQSPNRSSGTAVSQNQNATTVTKTSWPELRGLTIQAATAILEEDYPELEVVVVDRSEVMTLQREYNANRVILVTCNGNNLVATTPVIG